MNLKNRADIVRETEIEIEFKCGVTIRKEYVR